MSFLKRSFYNDLTWIKGEKKTIVRKNLSGLQHRYNKKSSPAGAERHAFPNRSSEM